VNGLSQLDRSRALGRHIAALDRINSDVIVAVGEQSVEAEYLKKLEERTADIQLEIQKSTDAVEGIDVASTIAAVQKQENLYQMSLQLTARMNQLSLADFLN
jgi:flagellin-like hook-associated protein FlgL